MDAIYVSIEKNTEVFEFYKNLWESRGITGIQVNSMSEGIEAAISKYTYGSFLLFPFHAETSSRKKRMDLLLIIHPFFYYFVCLLDRGRFSFSGFVLS